MSATTRLLAGSSALLLALPVFGQTQAPTEDSVPEGLSSGDWARIGAAHEAERYAVHPIEGGHEAHNPGQGWHTRFDGHGFLTEPMAGGWTWGLELERYGFAGSERAVTSPTRVTAEGGRVAYKWDAMLEEWYENDMRGLEHGYTVNTRPERGEEHGESPLTFTLAVRGELRPEVTADGRGIRFVDEGGAVALTYTGLTVFDADGRGLAASFERLGDGLLLSVDERGALYPISIDPIAQQAYLKPSSMDLFDEFGVAVAVSGDTVVVGSPGESSNATGVNGDHNDNSLLSSGAAYVFVRNGATWSQQAYLKASSNGEMFEWFGNSVAISGNTIVVGAPREDSNATGVNGNQGDNSTIDSGAAYVFVRNGTSWSQQAYLKASNTGSDDWFGVCVAVSGDTAVIGAYREDSSATGVNGDQSDNSLYRAGAAYVFVRSGTSWSQEAYLKASNTGLQDAFGLVAVSGDTVVVGAGNEDSSATGVNGDQSDNSAAHAGAAYVFVRNGSTWSQQAYLKASNTETSDGFGGVAVSGDTVVVGAPTEDSNATGVNGDQSDNSASNAGAAYVFVRSGTTWTQEAYLKASNADAGDVFGRYVGVSGERVVVTANGEDSGATGVNGDQSDNSVSGAGAAYVFIRSGGSWSQEAYLKASNTGPDFFGYSAAVSGDTVAAGAPSEQSNATGVNGDGSDNSGFQNGAAYVFGVGPGTSYCTASPNSTGAAATISASGSASVGANDLVLRAEPVPNQPGVFFYGPQQASIPFGNGTQCIGGQIGQLDVVNTTGNVMTFLLDNTNPPSAATLITPGSTWNFQAWFRDPAAGGAFFDLSDGLNVVFLP